MARGEKVATAIGQPLRQGIQVGDAKIEFGTPSVVFQSQPFGFVRLESPEQLRQWEEDLRTFYGISMDASALARRACETCSDCTDDCGLMA